MGWFDLAGSVLDIAGGLFSADMQNSATESMQQRNIDWEREQLTHKHQWEVEDLRKAGLNPILSAPNASSAVSAGSPQGANPDIKLSKTLEALANSALVKKQESSIDYQNQTDRIRAEADMIRAEEEKKRTNSIIGANEGQAKLYNMSADQIKQLTPLKVAYEKANIKKTEQDILNSVIEVRAKVQYYRDLGDAAKMQASAAQLHAQAAMSSAYAQQVIADVARQNGVSERRLKNALTGKADAETYEAMQRAGKIITEDKKLNWEIQKDMIHNPHVNKFQNDLPALPNILFGAGEYIKSGLGW